jgi:selenocysteine lyase/cysteine desulfurase
MDTSLESLKELIDRISEKDMTEVAKDEDFWLKIRETYRLKPDFINLENGYYNFIPEYILSRFIDHVREVNYEGPYYMRTVQHENKKQIASRLADLTGCRPDELIITRNSTESLDMIIGGLDWRPGDETVIAEQDYPCMLDMFNQISRRYGVVNKIISIPNHPDSDEEIVSLYEEAITERTKLLMVCHMVNITGQILPVKKICDMAHERGVLVMIDGAHTVGQIKFRIPDLGGDFFGSSLHKWLSVPLGAGLLWVRKDNIEKVWPVFAPEDHHADDDIIRLNHTGTHPVHTDLTIPDAIDFYKVIGEERKEARLRYLQRYWTYKVRSLPGVILNTPEDPARSCGIANVGIRGLKADDLADILIKKYNIYCAAVDIANVHGCRITPNIYTTTRELDVLVIALTELSIR